jgi:hypothetical protein
MNSTDMSSALRAENLTKVAKLASDFCVFLMLELILFFAMNDISTTLGRSIPL